MPLSQSPSNKSFGENVSELIRSGHPRKQSLAIAYGIQRKWNSKKKKKRGK
jgi:hypothetical protein